MIDLAKRLKILCPNLDLAPGGPVEVRDDSNGIGPYLAKWDSTLGPKPTETELAAVDVSAPEPKTPVEAMKAIVLALAKGEKPNSKDITIIEK